MGTPESPPEKPSGMVAFTQASIAALRGEYCACEQPEIVSGPHGTLCTRCSRFNQGHQEALEQRMREPHAFDNLDEHGKPRMGLIALLCAFCSRPFEDPRHR